MKSNKFNKAKWMIQSNWLKAFKIGDGAQTNKKVKLFTYSITIGLVVSTLFMFGFTDSPLQIFKDGIQKTFSIRGNLDRFIAQFATLALGGIAVAIGFKTGLFNIGVSGQMMAGGFTAYMIAINMGDSVPNGLGQVLIIMISMIGGALTGAFSGALKSYFRIHEVVSTILINWIVWYFMRWMMDPNSSTLINDTGSYSKMIGDNFMLRIDGFIIIPMIIILAITAVGIWFIIYKTSFGQQLKMVGQNKDAAKYAGLNEKALTIYAMALSGLVAGILGAVYYFGIDNSFAVPKGDAIPAEGFNGIAIALIAFSNPISILPVAFLFATIGSSVSTTAIVDPSYVSLALGVLMYISSINIIFSNFKIYGWSRRLLMGRDKFDVYRLYLVEKDRIHEEYIYSINELDKKSAKYKENKTNKIDKYFLALANARSEYVSQRKAVK